MERFFELGNKFAKNSDWKDFALVKFCLCAIGILIGLCIPKKHKSVVAFFSSITFISTYVVLLKKIFKIVDGMKIKEQPKKAETVQPLPANRYTTIYEISKL